MTLTADVDKLRETAEDVYGCYKNIICLDYKDYTEPPHIKKLADKLSELCEGKFDNLCVAMPPRHSKSSMVTLAFPMWLIMNDPSLNILIVNAESSLSEKFGIELRDYFKDFSIQTDKYVSDVKHSSTHLKFEDEYGNLYKGGIKLVGASGGITGQDADYIIIDDPYKGFEDITPSLLDKKIEWYRTKIVQRREPDSKLIICHTRWHTNDLQGYLKENNPNAYEFLEFPAIQDDNTPLWQERFSLEFLKHQAEEMGERLFSCIYQQKPLDESGSFFNIEKLRFEENTRRDYDYDITVRSYDLAYSDESKGDVNDYTASCLMSRTLTNEYIIHQVSMEQYGDRLFNVLQSTARVDTPNIPILMETGTVGGAAEFLFKEYKSKLQGYNVRQSKPIGSKVDRATPFKDAILDGKIIVDLPDEQREILLRQLQSFPLGKHDDLIDALSYAYNDLQVNNDYNIISTSNKRQRYTI
jgi:predicted phage terminase large subunit-like protein